MSPEERKELMASMSQAERRKLMQQLRGGGQEGRRGNPGQPRKAFVFVRDAQGTLTLKPVMVGLSSFEYTEIVTGLAEGDSVLQVPLALIQQQQMLQRFRDRSGVPGMSGN